MMGCCSEMQSEADSISVTAVIRSSVFPSQQKRLYFS
jgi:hypothetical protein